MAIVLWTQDDLEAELSAEVVRQFLDDDNDGDADADPLLRLQERSAGRVIGGLQRTYPAVVAAAEGWQADLDDVPERLRSLALDVATAILAKRHPEYVRRDWVKLFKFVNEEIARIRETGIDGLAIETTPETASNQGGSLGGGTDDGVTLTAAPVQFFTGPCGLGDF